jgi:hypothetical protein
VGAVAALVLFWLLERSLSIPTGLLIALLGALAGSALSKRR